MRTPVTGCDPCSPLVHRLLREWYANQHRHSGLALFTPADVFFGRVAEPAAARQHALDDAYAAHPERFVRGRPVVRLRLPPAKVEINPIDPGVHHQTAADVMTNAKRPKATTKCASPQPPAVVLPGVLHAGANVHAVCS